MFTGEPVPVAKGMPAPVPSGATQYPGSGPGDEKREEEIMLSSSTTNNPQNS